MIGQALETLMFVDQRENGFLYLKLLSAHAWDFLAVVRGMLHITLGVAL